MGAPPGVRLSGPGGVVAGLGGAQPAGAGAGAGDVGIEGQPAGDGGAEPGTVKVAGRWEQADSPGH